MQHSTFAATRPSPAPRTPSVPEYRAGTCNIGPAEIARRRRTGHVGLGATLLVFLGMVVLGLPPIVRLALFVPAAVGAAGYLQAWLKFCAAYGSLGVFNFGEAGRSQPVADPAARRRDRVRAAQISIASFVIGAAVALAAFLLPV